VRPTRSAPGRCGRRRRAPALVRCDHHPGHPRIRLFEGGKAIDASRDEAGPAAEERGGAREAALVHPVVAPVGPSPDADHGVIIPRRRGCGRPQLNQEAHARSGRPSREGWPGPATGGRGLHRRTRAAALAGRSRRRRGARADRLGTRRRGKRDLAGGGRRLEPGPPHPRAGTLAGLAALVAGRPADRLRFVRGRRPVGRLDDRRRRRDGSTPHVETGRRQPSRRALAASGYAIARRSGATSY